MKMPELTPFPKSPPLFPFPKGERRGEGMEGWDTNFTMEAAAMAMSREDIIEDLELHIQVR